MFVDRKYYSPLSNVISALWQWKFYCLLWNAAATDNKIENRSWELKIEFMIKNEKTVTWKKKTRSPFETTLEIFSGWKYFSVSESVQALFTIKHSIEIS